VDFWELARSRLRPGGVYTALFWGADVELLSRGMRAVFPTVLYFPAYDGSSFNVIAFRDETPDDEIRLHVERLGLTATIELRQLLETDPAGALQAELDAAIASRPAFASVGADATARLHTDDFPVLEYRWTHGIEWVSILDSPLVAVE